MSLTNTQERTVIHGSFTIERNYPAKPERVFAAFAEAEKKRRWFMDSRGMEFEEYQLDFRVGGTEVARSRFKEGSPFPGVSMTNHTTYQDIVTNKRIVLAYTMTIGDRRISASLSTFEFVETDKGTNLVYTDQGAYFEGADGPKMRQDGWTKLLERVASEVAA